MSTNLEDAARGDARYYGMLTGIVTANKDPRGLHRVQALIPGIAEPNTDWLWPMTAGGGSPDRGGHVVPAVGSDVCIWFKQGDPHSMGVYGSGWWGVPDATGSEVPYDARSAPSPELVQTLRVGRIIATVDETPGAEFFRIYDTEGAFALQVDLVKKVVQLTGLTALQLGALGAVNIQASEVTVQGRRVNTSSSPI